MGCIEWIIILGIVSLIFEYWYISLAIIFVYLIVKGISLYLNKTKYQQQYKISSICKNTIDKIKIYNFKIYEKKYYKSEQFYFTKQRVEKYIANCNELNCHIMELKRNIYTKNSIQDNGNVKFYDYSTYNYNRPTFQNHDYNNNVYNCSKTVCDNARLHPFKYICKYFGIKYEEEYLSAFETLLNNFEAAKEGEEFLEKEKNQIILYIYNEIPDKIKKYGMDRFQYELGFIPIKIRDIEFPQYTFLYVSSGGYASVRCDIVMDFDNLNKFILYLAENIKFKKSVAGQRALMTSSLRRKILYRDNFICKNCGNGVHLEPNLLLEVDHIIPLSKGGLTTEDNLQTLCWRCNRSKGAKIV